MRYIQVQKYNTKLHHIFSLRYLESPTKNNNYGNARLIDKASSNRLIAKLGYHGAKRLINHTSWPITTAQIVLMSIRFCGR